MLTKDKIDDLLAEYDAACKRGDFATIERGDVLLVLSVQAKRAVDLKAENDRLRQAANPRLRDYFAAAALQGLLACPQNESMYSSDFAKHAYVYADAMLKARERKEVTDEK